MGRYVLHLRDIDKSQVALVGGKAAGLGELTHLNGVLVPAGFCVTTAAFQHILANEESVNAGIEALSHLAESDRDAIRESSAEIREKIERTAIPNAVAAEILAALARAGEDVAYAVRSSATAEDTPAASFAGQQDTYLNVIGSTAILQHIRRCWGSLFTERAVTYRMRNGYDHRRALMAVVVQRMVFPSASGILFTADPVSGNRKVSSIDASFGLGEALVSGIVNPDVYKVRDNAVIDKTIGIKKQSIQAMISGGTHERPVAADRWQEPALTDEQVVRLAQIGRNIEAHFGRPQDIEWCLIEGEFQIVQSRPITTLFPIPVAGDAWNHVYMSVGHQQMMTDAMTPFGLSFWQMTTLRPMAEAGGRLFVDVSAQLASPGRAAFLKMVGKGDLLTLDALQSILARGDFIPAPSVDSNNATGPNASGTTASSAPATVHRVIEASAAAPREADPALVTELIQTSERSLAALKRDIQSKEGIDVLDFIKSDIPELQRVLFAPQSLRVIMSGMDATYWLNEHLQEWLGEKNAADTLTQSVANNVTSEMGLALLHVADVIRPHPDVVRYLERATNDDFLAELPSLNGGNDAKTAIETWLDMYGMRGVGEIDITRSRWREAPTMLLPLLLGNIRNFEQGAGERRFNEGLQQARKKEDEILRQLQALPDGDAKADETKRMIDRVRTFIGYREFPKYGMVNRYFVYKKAIMKVASQLAQAGIIDEVKDVFFLRFNELYEAVRTNRVNRALIQQRKEEFRFFQTLRPPRVLTSEGEMLNGSYRRGDLPAGALIGLPVSAGTIEGRARIILDFSKADLEPGDILVTAFTDPSWTPLFVAIKGLVTEVGGLMTHGAVIAREYGLPAIVGVENATRLIKDGQHIRVHGTEGYIELLDGSSHHAR